MSVYLIEGAETPATPPLAPSMVPVPDVLYTTPPPDVGAPIEGVVQYEDAYGGAGGAYNAQILNRAWHTPTAQWVYWKTDAPDPTGLSYPGPGNFGDCTNYGVETIVYVPA